MSEKTKKDLEDARKRVELLEKQLNGEIEEAKKREMAMEMFRYKFGLSFISDDYNIYADEYYQQAEQRFITDFSNDDSDYKKLEEIRITYIDLIQDDINTLQKQLDFIINEYKELQKEVK